MFGIHVVIPVVTGGPVKAALCPKGVQLHPGFCAQTSGGFLSKQEMKMRN